MSQINVQALDSWDSPAMQHCWFLIDQYANQSPYLHFRALKWVEQEFHTIYIQAFYPIRFCSASNYLRTVPYWMVLNCRHPALTRTMTSIAQRSWIKTQLKPLLLQTGWVYGVLLPSVYSLHTGWVHEVLLPMGYSLQTKDESATSHFAVLYMFRI